MKSRRTLSFRVAFDRLPSNIQVEAREAYRLFVRNPDHPSLRFEKKHTKRPIWSARINREYRVLGVIEGDTIIWFWIGPHDQYERLLKGQ